jgi:hypothetical protein
VCKGIKSTLSLGSSKVTPESGTVADLRASISRLLRFESARGEEWTDGRVTVTPIARSAILGAGLGGPRARPLEQRRGFYNLSWPTAVQMSVDGRTYRAPIVDVTRLSQLAIVLAALLIVFETWTRRGKELS